MAIDSNFYKQKKAKGMYFSLAFLLFVIVLTGGLFFYNQKLEGENETRKSEIANIEKSIETEKQDKDIEAYYIYNLNKKALDSFSIKSKIPTFIEHALRTRGTYNLEFQDFSYSSGKIGFNVSAESDDKGLAYSKVVKFLNEYSKRKESIFTLEPVENFTGQDAIKFPITFTINEDHPLLNKS